MMIIMMLSQQSVNHIDFYSIKVDFNSDSQNF